MDEAESSDLKSLENASTNGTSKSPSVWSSPNNLAENGDFKLSKLNKNFEKNKMPKEFSMQNLSKINALSRMTTELNLGLTMTNKE